MQGNIGFNDINRVIILKEETTGLFRYSGLITQEIQGYCKGISVVIIFIISNYENCSNTLKLYATFGNL